MEEEWMRYLRETAPQLHKAALASIKHQCDWRDRVIMRRSLDTDEALRAGGKLYDALKGLLAEVYDNTTDTNDGIDAVEVAAEAIAEYEGTKKELEG